MGTPKKDREEVRLTKQDAQAMADFLYKELHRHWEDIVNILDDLKKLEKKWGVSPTKRFVGKWIEI